jgi:hypothetical protein
MVRRRIRVQRDLDDGAVVQWPQPIRACLLGRLLRVVAALDDQRGAGKRIFGAACCRCQIGGLFDEGGRLSVRAATVERQALPVFTIVDAGEDLVALLNAEGAGIGDTATLLQCLNQVCGRDLLDAGP